MLQAVRKNLFSIIVIAVVLAALALLLTPQAFAEQSEISKSVCEGVTSASGGSCSATGSATSIETLINNAINILSWIIGVIAVFMIIFGGFKFVTSGGESGKITSARQTIVYALVGIVIVVLAQTIVKFVIGRFM